MSANKERQIADYQDRCVHFTGLRGPGMVKHEACAAGVRYDDVTVDHAPMTYKDSSGTPHQSTKSRPCHGRYNHCGVICAKRETPTREAAEEHVREGDRMVANYVKARGAITASKKKSGSVDCPICTTGALNFGIAPNGHIHAKCNTEGCVAWME